MTDPTCTIHLTDDVAEAVLDRQGWRTIRTHNDKGQLCTYYVRPGGKARREGGIFGADFLWERDEAVTNAIQESVAS